MIHQLALAGVLSIAVSGDTDIRPIDEVTLISRIGTVGVDEFCDAYEALVDAALVGVSYNDVQTMIDLTQAYMIVTLEEEGFGEEYRMTPEAREAVIDLMNDCIGL